MLWYNCPPTPPIYDAKVAAQVNFLNGQAVFDLESIKLSAAIHDKMFQGLKSGLGLKAGLGLLPDGEIFCHHIVICIHHIDTSFSAGYYKMIVECNCAHWLLDIAFSLLSSHSYEDRLMLTGMWACRCVCASARHLWFDSLLRWRQRVWRNLHKRPLHRGSSLPARILAPGDLNKRILSPWSTLIL